MDIFGSFPGSLGQDNPKPSLPVQRSRRRYGIRLQKKQEVCACILILC
jgi:hypothetical protein